MTSAAAPARPISSLLTFLLAAIVLSPASSAQAPAAFDAVAPAMQAFVDKGEVAGVVTLLADRKSILHLGAAGRSDIAAGRRMRTSDIFWVASMTKPIAAVAVAILVDDGKLSFDDPLSKYLTELPAPSRAITLRDVLTHTAGLGELTNRDPHLTLAQTARQIAEMPLRFPPRTRWSYSTAGFDVLGRVVEIVSGMPFDRFLQERVFDPLEMKDTSFWVSSQSRDRWAHSYQWVAAEGKLRETTIPYMYGTDVFDRTRPPLGGAGLFSTAADIGRFYQMMLSRGSMNGRRILSPATVVEMTRKQTGDLVARPGMPWGLGFSVVEDPALMEANKPLSPGSFGHGGAYSTQSWADPARGLIWVVMFQRTGKGNPDNSDVRIAFQDAVPGRYR